jgi:hypothetical protein
MQILMEICYCFVLPQWVFRFTPGQWGNTEFFFSLKLDLLQDSEKQLNTMLAHFIEHLCMLHDTL